MSNSRTLGLTVSSVLLLAGFAGAASAKPASPYQILYTFTGGNDGGWPTGNLIADKIGNIYGTTSVGGPNGAGTVFKLAPDGTETVLYHFTGGHDGDLPLSGLLADGKGNLYGVTEVGGKNGGGNVFKVTPDGVATSLYDFGTTSTDGWNPICKLIWGPHHELLGTTLNGGTHAFGTVFQLTLAGKLTTLHDFNGTNGRYPSAGLVMDPAGNVYGSTFNSGDGSSGTVYRIDAKGVFRTIVTLSDASGYFSKSALTLDRSGNLYGTATAGGAYENGTVFKVPQKGPLSVVYSFTGGSDGSTPAAEVFADRQGNLLGTTNAGGIGDNGTIFSITPDHKLTTLYSFTGATGSHPSARLIEDQAEGFIWLYGSTYVGGNGNGVIFRVKR